MSFQFRNQGIAQVSVWVALPLPLDFTGICPVLLAKPQEGRCGKDAHVTCVGNSGQRGTCNYFPVLLI